MACKSAIRSAQKGYGVLVLMMAVLVLGASSVGMMFYNPRAANAVDERRSGDALAAAKDALVAYAVGRGTATGLARPGELPCPDTNNDGIEEPTCTAGTIGRIPWKTMGIAEPKDSAGETLWYAIAGPFRTQPSNTSRINSNTRGNLVVRGPDGVAVLTGEAVAVLFAPGPTLGSQIRSGATATCATTGSTVPQNRCAANYLEGTNGTNNAVTNGPFIAGPRGNTYNDRVLHVATTDLIPTVEMRVGNELRALLLEYRTKSECRCYPWADSWLYSGGIADIGLNRGRFPSVAYPENWGEGAIPRLPAWVAANDWQNVAYYSAAKQETDGAGSKCIFCSPAQTLTVTGSAVSALVFTPGTPTPGIDRTLAANINNLATYLEDPANNDVAICPGVTTENANTILNIVKPIVPAACDIYVKPTSTRMDRDRIFTVSTTPTSQCAPAARALLENAPCKDNSADQISGVCAEAAAQLATCSCAAVAQQLLVVPCRNTLNSSHCPAPIAQLKTCNS